MRGQISKATKMMHVAWPVGKPAMEQARKSQKMPSIAGNDSSKNHRFWKGYLGE